MDTFDIIFEKLAEIQQEDAAAHGQELADGQELDEIDELRRLAAEIAQPEPILLTVS